MPHAPSRMPLPPLLLAVGGALLTISGRSQALSQAFPFPLAFQCLLYGGLAFDFVALAWLAKILVVWFLALTGVRTGQRCEPMCTLVAGYAKESEKVELYEFLKQDFRESAPTPDVLISWFKVNPEIFPVIREINHDTGESKIVCAARVFPLRKHLIPLLNSEWVNGTSIRPADIAKPGEKPGCIYVGCVASRPDCRTLWVSTLVRTLGPLIDGSTPLFIRPTTNYGMKYTRRFPFVPVKGKPGLGHIYRIGADDALREINQLRSARGLAPRRIMRMARPIHMEEIEEIGRDGTYPNHCAEIISYKKKETSYDGNAMEDEPDLQERWCFTHLKDHLGHPSRILFGQRTHSSTVVFIWLVLCSALNLQTDSSPLTNRGVFSWIRS